MEKALLRGMCLGCLLATTGMITGCRDRSLNDDAGGRTPADLLELADDVFREMDGGIALAPDEIKGRNTWNLWTGGNEQFWDRMARESFGLMDLLKTIDSRRRAERFRDMGLINQPGYRQASRPDEYGLWIDEAVTPEPAAIDPAVYGRATGIMGMRLFPNPAFDAAAKARWDANRYYTDPDYAVDPKLVRPYRVGVSCGVCHITFNPLRPPADPAEPRLTELMSALGNQYIREGRVFANNVREGGLFWEMLKVQPPGTSDTSRIATDHINNPNTINPIFLLGQRLAAGPVETMAGETLLLPTVQETQQVPMVLKDGADSVGVPGATLRVYINIGMYSQHWLQQHNALVGLSGQKPFSVETAQEHSVFWRATEEKFTNIARFFMRLQPLHLADAPGGAAHMTDDAAVLRRGKEVFAENCAKCHSSKRPPEGLAEAERTAWFVQSVLRDDFLEGNLLSDERRHSVARLGTNAARAMGTNAMAGHIWANFSSQTYKELPSVGKIEYYDPYADATKTFEAPAGGPGYYRTPSLISIWTSAPFLHNNALGKYTGDPSVDGRMEAFNDAVEKLLWPERRLGHASIWRTSRECSLQLQASVLPKTLQLALREHIDDDGYLRIGPIPGGTPVNLLANIDPDTGRIDLAKLIIRIKRVLLEIKLKGLDSAEAKALMRDELAPALLAASKCPDLVTDRGHEFGKDLPDADKRALIEFLKTF